MPQHLFWIWRAWHRLDPDRPWIPGGMGPSYPGRIPWQATMLWADRHGYGWAEAEMLDMCLRAMDSEFLDYWIETHPPPKG